MTALAILIAQMLDPVRIVLCALIYWLLIGRVYTSKGLGVAAVAAAFSTFVVGLAMIFLLSSASRISPLSGVVSFASTGVWLAIFLFVGFLKRR